MSHLVRHIVSHVMSTLLAALIIYTYKSYVKNLGEGGVTVASRGCDSTQKGCGVRQTLIKSIEKLEAKNYGKCNSFS